MQKKTALLLAGGKGLRAGGGIPKQFRKLHGRPLLWWSLRAFYTADPATRIAIVLPEGQHGLWEAEFRALPAAEQYSHITATGGSTRCQSVFNGLLALWPDGETAEGLVAVHDGARPLVSRETVIRGFEAAAKFEAVVPFVPLTDSIRKLATAGDPERGSEVADRSKFVAVQTPQVFDAGLLMRAYREMDSEGTYTDDASVVERIHPVHLYPGNPANIKVTNPDDFAIAEALLK